MVLDVPPAILQNSPMQTDAHLIREFNFGSLPPDADGWYVWRVSPTWPVSEYKCIEVCNPTGNSPVMVDSEPTDSHGALWRVVECKPYGEFHGPILLR
jgi:hypothetical protein